MYYFSSITKIGILLILTSFVSFSGLKAQEKQPNTTQVKENLKLTKAPALISGQAIVYPELSIAEKHEGQVKVRIEITKNGLVKRVEIIKSSEYVELDVAALVGITTFIFSPAEFNNKPSAVAIEYQQDFFLDQLEAQKLIEEQAQLEEEQRKKAEEEQQINDSKVLGNKEAGSQQKLESQLSQSLKKQNFEDMKQHEVQQNPKGVLNFEGIVRKAGSNTPLSDVEVTAEIDLTPEELKADNNSVSNEDKEMGFRLVNTFTDPNGHFSFFDLPLGKHRFSFATTGYEASFINEEIKENERTENIVYLKKLSNNILETVVRERKAQKEVSKVTLSREEVRKIPGTFGDPLRVIENLPGLARAPFAGGALLVRGASPQDSGIYFDGVPIPIIYHFGGLKSVVNAEFLEDLSFYPGGFGSYYGRATAGIVDVQSRKLDMNDFHGFTDISVIDSSFYFAAPLKLGILPKITIAAAARRSYLDAILPIVLEAIPQANGTIASPVYWDYQLKASTEPWPGQRFSLFLFGSNDTLKVVGAQNNASFNVGVNQGFHRLVGTWKSQISKHFTHSFQPFIGFNSTDFNGSFGDSGGQFGLGTYNWGLRDQLTWKINDELQINTGIDYIGQTFGIALSFPIPNEIVSFPRVNTHIAEENTAIKSSGYTQSFGYYLETIYEPFENLKLVPGLRFEYTNVLYEEQEDGDEKALTSSPRRWSVDPRITFRYSPLEKTTVKGAIGIYRQNPQGQDVNPAIGNVNLVMPRALQIIGGFEHSLSRHLNLDIQAYATFRDLIVQSTSELKTLGNGEFAPVNLNNGGMGHTFGMEFLLRHEIGKYSLVFARDFYKNWLPIEIQPYIDPLFTEMSAFGWIAYTLSRTEIDQNDRKTDDFILSQFDQTHILTLVGQLNLPLDFSIGLRFRLVTGNPTTRPVGSVHDLDTTNYNRLSQPQQSSRLPAFHQLDLRIDRKFVFDNFKLTPYLDLLNVYNQPNAETYQNDYRFNKQEAITGLPILPNFGLQGEF